MTDNIVKLVVGNAAKPEAVPDMLNGLAEEWREKPLGTGVIVVVVHDEETPTIYGYGDCGSPLTELEMARAKLLHELMERWGYK